MKSAEIMIKVLQPYPGLRPFQSNEADIFYGRGEQIDALLGTLEDNKVVAVVGASGSGKSSLVRAGLIPALEAGFLSDAGPNWRMVVMRPGKAPFSQLAVALLEAAGGEPPADPQRIAFTEATLRSGPRGLLEAIEDLEFPADTNVLLLVDQFEEVFRFRHRDGVGDSTSSQRNEATAFVNMLLATRASEEFPIYGVITMRSDFLGDCDAFHGLPEAINACQFLVPRLRRDQVRDTITGPLDLFGARAEEGLVNRILNKIGSDPDQLPLMQHLLLRMWLHAEKRSGDDDIVLSVDDYEAVGGMDDALSQHADEVFDELGDDQNKRVAEVMFRSLCDRGADARLTRRLVTLAEVAEVAGVDTEQVKEVAERFLGRDRSFLTYSPPGDVTPNTTLDISHEAMIRQWDRLIHWIAAEERSANIYRRLTETAQLWKAGRASLLVSPELDIGLNWRDREQPSAAWAERYGGGFDLSMEFFEASLAEQQAQAERQQREARRKTLILVRTLVLVSALLILAGVFWWRSRTQSIEHKNMLIESQLSLGTASIRDGRMNEGLLRYAAAYEMTNPKQPARESALNLIAAWSELAGRPLVHDDSVKQVAFVPDGQSVLTVTDRVARRWSLESGEPVGEAIVAQDGPWRTTAISPDAASVLVASGDSAQLWDVLTGRSLGKPLAHGETILAVAISADGGTLATRGADGTQLWHANTGEPRGRRWPNRQDRAPADRPPALSPDGGAVITSRIGRAILVDVDSGESTESSPETPAFVRFGAFSPDGTRVITVGLVNPRLRQTQSWQTPAVQLQHGGVEVVAFSRDGTMVVTGSSDNTARIWNAETGEPIGPPLLHQGTVISAAFDPSGKMILTGSTDNTAQLWNVADGAPLMYPMRHAGTVNSVAFSEDGQTLLTGSVDRTARLWRRRTRVSFREKMGDGRVLGTVRFSPRGGTATIQGAVTGTTLFDLKTGSQFDLTKINFSAMSPVRLSPDANSILTINDNVVNLWDAATNQKLKEFSHDAPIALADFGPRGETILTVVGASAYLWDVKKTDGPINAFPHNSRILDAAINTTGDRVATAGEDSAARLWEVGSAKPIGDPLEHGDVVLAVAFSPNGQLVATSSADNTAAIWNARTSASVKAALAHRDAVVDVTFSPDGATLLSACLDMKARFWDVASGESRGDPLLHAGQVTGAVYHPNGRQAFTTDDKGSAWIWNVVPPAVDEPQQLQLSIEWRSGHEFDEHGDIRKLTHATWLVQKRKLDALGGPCDVRDWDDPGTSTAGGTKTLTSDSGASQ